MRKEKLIHSVVGYGAIIFWLLDIGWRYTISSNEFLKITFTHLAHQFAMNMIVGRAYTVISLLINVALVVAIYRIIYYLYLLHFKRVERNVAITNIKIQLFVIIIAYLLFNTIVVRTLFSPIEVAIVKLTKNFLYPVIIPVNLNLIGGILSSLKSLLILLYIITIPPIKPAKVSLIISPKNLKTHINKLKQNKF